MRTLASRIRGRTPWFGIYLPQLRMRFDRILERTLAAEAAGFDSVWLMDHFTAPTAPEVDTFEGLTVATALAARTSTIRIGHLVLCDPFRHPGAAREDGGDARRDLGRPARARHRLGFGARRARDVRVRARTAGGPRREAARDARDPRADVRGRAVRLRRRALPAAARDRAAGAGAGARARAHRRRRTEAHDAARRAVRRLVELPGLRARPPRRAPAARRATRASRRSTRSGSPPTLASRDEAIADGATAASARGAA